MIQPSFQKNLIEQTNKPKII